MATTPVFLPGKSHGQRNLAGYSPWVRRDTTEHTHTHTHTHTQGVHSSRIEKNERDESILSIRISREGNTQSFWWFPFQRLS